MNSWPKIPVNDAKSIPRHKKKQKKENYVNIPVCALEYAKHGTCWEDTHQLEGLLRQGTPTTAAPWAHPFRRASRHAPLALLLRRVPREFTPWRTTHLFLFVTENPPFISSRHDWWWKHLICSCADNGDTPSRSATKVIHSFIQSHPYQTRLHWSSPEFELNYWHLT